MAKTEHHDQTRREAADAGLPPDVHDPATLAAYAALERPAKAEPKAEHASKATKGKAKARS
jgi:hypothetical protein